MEHNFSHYTIIIYNTFLSKTYSSLYNYRNDHKTSPTLNSLIRQQTIKNKYSVRHILFQLCLSGHLSLEAHMQPYTLSHCLHVCT